MDKPQKKEWTKPTLAKLAGVTQSAAGTVPYGAEGVAATAHGAGKFYNPSAA